MAASSSSHISWPSFPQVCTYFMQRRVMGEDELAEVMEEYKQYNIDIDVYIVVFNNNHRLALKRNGDPPFCNRFNHRKGLGCTREDCHYRHACLICNSPKHGVYYRNQEGTSFVCKRHEAISRELAQLTRLHPRMTDADFHYSWLAFKQYAQSLPVPSELPKLGDLNPARFAPPSIRVDDLLFKSNGDETATISGVKTAAHFTFFSVHDNKKLADFRISAPNAKQSQVLSRRITLQIDYD